MNKSTVVELVTFLTSPINSVSREVLLTHRFMYDMTLAAALAEYALLSFDPAVDRDGVDVVLSDQDTIRPVQLKTTMKRVTSSSSVKNVHAGVLKPHHDLAERIQFGATGQGGAVVLMETLVDAPQTLGVRYWYTDAHVLMALLNGLVPGAPQSAERDARALINELQQVRSNSRVVVRVSCFLPLESPSALLGIGGWHAPAPFHNGNWQYHLGERLRPLSREDVQRREASAAANTKLSAEAQDKRWEVLVAEALQSFVAWPARARKPVGPTKKPATSQQQATASLTSSS